MLSVHVTRLTLWQLFQWPPQYLFLTYSLNDIADKHYFWYMPTLDAVESDDELYWDSKLQGPLLLSPLPPSNPQPQPSLSPITVTHSPLAYRRPQLYMQISYWLSSGHGRSHGKQTQPLGNEAGARRHWWWRKESIRICYRALVGSGAGVRGKEAMQGRYRRAGETEQEVSQDRVAASKAVTMAFQVLMVTS